MGASFSKIINCEHCIDCIERCKHYPSPENRVDTMNYCAPSKSCIATKSISKENKNRRVSFH